MSLKAARASATAERQLAVVAKAEAAAQNAFEINEVRAHLGDVIANCERQVVAIQALEHEIAHISGENRELKTKLAQIESTLAELRIEARGKTLDGHDTVRVN